MKKYPQSSKELLLRFRDISEQGLYYQYLKRGLMKRIVSDDLISVGLKDSPTGTRAEFRSKMIKKFGDKVKEVGWAYLGLEFEESFLSLSMPDPAGVDEELLLMLR